jgi:hypothetical protein
MESKVKKQKLRASRPSAVSRGLMKISAWPRQSRGAAEAAAPLPPCSYVSAPALGTGASVTRVPRWTHTPRVVACRDPAPSLEAAPSSPTPVPSEARAGRVPLSAGTLSEGQGVPVCLPSGGANDPTHRTAEVGPQIVKAVCSTVGGCSNVSCRAPIAPSFETEYALGGGCSPLEFGTAVYPQPRQLSPTELAASTGRANPRHPRRGGARRPGLTLPLSHSQQDVAQKQLESAY